MDNTNWLNHKTAPVAVRERLLAGCQEEKKLLPDLMALDGVREAMFLSTCNRIELVACINGGRKPGRCVIFWPPAAA